MANSKKAAAGLVAAQFEPLVAKRYLGVTDLTPEMVTTYRPRNNVVTDPRLKNIISCMRKQLAGKHYGSIPEQRSAFKSARSSCRM